MKTIKLHSSIFGPSGCINESAFKDYFEDKLSVEEIRSFENHISECMLCSDAFDGFEKQASAGNAVSDISSITKEIRTRYASKTIDTGKIKNNKRYIITGLSIAACILLLITSYFLIDLQTKQSSKEVAIESIKPEEKTTKSVEDLTPTTRTTTVVNSQTTKDQREEAEKTEDKKFVLDGEQKASGFKIANITVVQTKATEKDRNFKTDIIQAGDNYRGLKEEQNYKNGIDQTKQQPATTATFGLTTTVSADEISTGKSMNMEDVQIEQKDQDHYKKLKNKGDKSGELSKTVVAGAAQTTTLNSAIGYYNSSDYENSIAECERMISSDNKNYEAIYYLAMSYYKTGQKDKAIDELDKIVKNKHNSFYELALWQKATILIEEDKKKEALELLDEIVKRSGSMKTNAQKKIDELDIPK